MASLIEKIKGWLGLGTKVGAAPGKIDDKDLLTGTITHFNWNKGYGFIESPDIPERIFLHRTKLKSRLKTGDTVLFKLGRDKRGYHAEVAFSPNRGKDKRETHTKNTKFAE